MPKDDKDEPISMTKGELEAMLQKRDADANMDPGEKRIREIVREESGATFREALSEFFDTSDDGGDGGNNDGGLSGSGQSIGDWLKKQLATT